MTLEQLQDELGRLYMRAGELSQIAAEHAKASRFPQAYRSECEALELQKAAQALWPVILDVVISERKAGDEERARVCAQELTT